MSAALLVGKALLIGKSWMPDIEETDVLLTKLVEIRGSTVLGEQVTDVFDIVLDYRRSLYLSLQEKGLSWPVTS